MKKIQAKHYHEGRIAPVRLLVVHTMEWPETVTAAEDCARMFATMTRPASAHVCGDSNSRVRCVDDSDTAFAAPGGNADGLHYEFAGRAGQSAAQWADEYSQAALRVAAQQFAEWCKKYKIPVRFLTRSQLRAGLKGFTTHADISAVYRRSDHTDPGPNFPKALFLGLVDDLVKGKPEEDPIKIVLKGGVPQWPGRVLKLAEPLMRGADVRIWQHKLADRGWTITVDGIYGKQSNSVCAGYQEATGLPASGKVDAATWAMTWSWKPPTTP